MSDRKVKVGVVGLGNMGSQHLVYVSNIPTMELAACCDIVPEKAQKAGEKYNIPYFTDAEEMMKSGLIEAIVIAVPHYDHTTIAIAAFAHDLHVLTEKPVGVHKNDILKMIAAHKAHPEKRFAAMFQQRMLPIYQKVRQLVQRGELGAIQRINWIITDWFRSQAYYDSGSWRATWKGEGGGVLLNQCPHHIDLYQWIFGMPCKVRGFCGIGKYHKIEVEDEVTAFFEYEDGKTAIFITSTGEAPGTNRLEITCDRGKVIVENGKISFTRNEIPTKEYRETTPKLFGTGTTWNIDVPFGAPPSTPLHQLVLENFADSILNGTELVAPAEEGLNSVELANSMLFSSMQGETVNMPLNGDAYEAMLKDLIAKSSFEKQEATGATPTDMAASFGK